MPSILNDDRFKVMFENPDFQVDEKSEEFRLLNPLVSKISEKRKKKLKMLELQEAAGEVNLVVLAFSVILCAPMQTIMSLGDGHLAYTDGLVICIIRAKKAVRQETASVVDSHGWLIICTVGVSMGW